MNDIESIMQRDPVQALALIRKEREQRARWFPSKNFTPHIGQERFFKLLENRNESGNFPTEIIVRCANGWGKTATAAITLAGCCLGPEFLDEHFFGKIRFFQEFKELRKRRKIHIRWVGDAADMAEEGSAYQQIQKWIPTAEFGNKQGSYYTKVTIPSPEPGTYFPTTIDFKTHEQAITAHAGPDYDLIIFNEPPPQDIYAENATRTRKGGLNEDSGYIMSFFTPLWMAAYMHKIEHSEHKPGTFAIIEGAIWDNCKDIEGNRGHLAKSKIEELKRRWEIENPLQVPARELGKYMFLAGAVFPIFNRQNHVIPTRNVPPEWNTYFVLDPHPSKPPVATWIALDCIGNSYVIAEYPTEPWDSIISTHKTIRDFAVEFSQIEQGKWPIFKHMQNLYVVERYGDPNSMPAEQPNTRRSSQLEYELATGWHFNVKIDDEISVRLDALRELMKYDPQKPPTSFNSPHFFIFDCCHNTIRAFEEFAFKTKQGQGQGFSDKLEDTWKCWIDCCGYYAVTHDPWQRRLNPVDLQDEQETISRSRDPFYYNPTNNQEENLAYSGQRFV